MAKQQEKGIGLIFKKKAAHLAQTRNANNDNRSCREIEKSFCAGKANPNICFRTKHVRNEINVASVIPTIRGEDATHRNCSQFFHTCLQRNIGSARNSEFRDG